MLEPLKVSKSFLTFIYSLYVYMCMCVHVCACMCTPQNTYGSSEDTCRSWFFHSTMYVPGVSQVVRLGGSHLYLLSHHVPAPKSPSLLEGSPLSTRVGACLRCSDGQYTKNSIELAVLAQNRLLEFALLKQTLPRLLQSFG